MERKRIGTAIGFVGLLLIGTAAGFTGEVVIGAHGGISIPNLRVRAVWA